MRKLLATLYVLSLGTIAIGLGYTILADISMGLYLLWCFSMGLMITHIWWLLVRKGD